MANCTTEENAEKQHKANILEICTQDFPQNKNFMFDRKYLTEL